MIHRSTKLTFLLCGILIIFAASICFITRNSYTGETRVDDINTLNSTITETSIDAFAYGDIYFNNSISDFKQLKSESDYILLVQSRGKRELYTGGIKTNVVVNKVFKGENILEGDSIYIMEPNSISFNLSHYESFGGYNLLLDENQYLIFVNQLTIPKNYSFKNDEAITFVPVSTYYSKYTIVGNNIIDAISSEELETIPYSKIKEYTIITDDSSIIAKYKELLERSKKEFKLN